MNITEYKTTILEEQSIVKNKDDNDLSYYIVDRKYRKLYFFDRSLELAQILYYRDFGIDDQDSLPSVVVELKMKYLCIYSEELGLSLYDFYGNPIVHLSQNICYAYFDSENDILWTIRRDDNDHITILVYNYAGDLCALLTMNDPLYHSEFSLEPLPEKYHMAICFGGGQDGSQDYFLSLEGNVIKVLKALPEDVTYLLSVAEGREAILLNFYEQKLFHVTYPDLKEIGEYENPDEQWDIDAVWQLSDDTLLLADDGTWRIFLFHIPTMSITEEIVVKGHEAKKDADGYFVTDLERVDYRNNHLLFLCMDTEDCHKRQLLSSSQIIVSQ